MPLAMASASSSVSKRKSGATGPKVSSLARSMPVVASVSTTGAVYCGPSGRLRGLVMIVAPLETASSIWARILAMAGSLIIGPMETPASVPGPTRMASTRSASFFAKAS
ncbi:hypothetical protein D3C72_1219300 [compost metagenome]